MLVFNFLCRSRSGAVGYPVEALEETESEAQNNGYATSTGGGELSCGSFGSPRELLASPVLS